MSKAIPVEIRSLVGEAYKSGEGTYKVLSIRFSVGINSVVRWVKLDKLYSNLSPRPYGGGIPPKIRISEYDELKALLIEKPDTTIKELAWEWGQRKGEIIHASSMSRALRRAGFSTKKDLPKIPIIATPLMVFMVAIPLVSSNEILPQNRLVQFDGFSSLI